MTRRLLVLLVLLLAAASMDSRRAGGETFTPQSASGLNVTFTTEKGGGTRILVFGEVRNVTTAPNAAGLGTAAGEYIVQARPGTASRARRAAWVSGLLLELAYEARRNKQAELADRILIECHNLESAAEGHLIAYLMEGFKEVRQMPLDPLIEWK